MLRYIEALRGQCTSGQWRGGYEAQKNTYRFERLDKQPLIVGHIGFERLLMCDFRTVSERVCDEGGAHRTLSTSMLCLVIRLYTSSLSSYSHCPLHIVVFVLPMYAFTLQTLDCIAYLETIHNASCSCLPVSEPVPQLLESCAGLMPVPIYRT